MWGGAHGSEEEGAGARHEHLAIAPSPSPSLPPPPLDTLPSSPCIGCAKGRRKLVGCLGAPCGCLQVREGRLGWLVGYYAQVRGRVQGLG